MMPNTTIPAILLLDGFVSILISIFANKIGLDPTQGWGRFRFMIFFGGIALISISLFLIYLKDKRNNLSLFLTTEKAKTLFPLFHLWGVVFLLYAWFITFGNFTTWDHTTHYYTQLASAFSKGQLYVDLKPGAALAEAPDPYHPTDRPPFNDEIWDMSLYKEKLFLYWGPVPALLITPIQMIFRVKITDNYLVFLFLAGLFIFNSLIILRLKNIFFSDTPNLITFISVLLIGLILPVLWSLSTPNVYSAAIGAGQFFLLGSIYFIILAVTQEEILNKRMFLAGAFLACAVGSRAINVFSVIFLVLLVSFWIIRKKEGLFHLSNYIQPLFFLYAPLILGAILIGWYNWMRFDSPFEFGLRYQITIFNLNKDMNLVFRPEYFALNMYSYIFQPFQVIDSFPFIQPVTVSTMLNEHGIATPYLYAAGRMTGIVFGAPFLVLSLTHVSLGTIKSRIRQFLNNPQPYEFVISILAGTFLINFLQLLFFFFGQMRYLVDSISQISLLAIIGYWKIYSLKTEGGFKQPKIVLLLANVLLALTICTGFLLALTGEANRMQLLNPGLFDGLNNFFSITK